ncbi:MFS transporter [Novosphingobium flavum]|uniref:MFS transporter n=1 Tax=Novosphingobium flavum TaxID=1778672 RepID=A0A7X1FV03_9SPHN|nr:MFS transporter [Novosphingobium flavum]MBC2667478.1 MFS transporter [Novosphingobium flavum]
MAKRNWVPLIVACPIFLQNIDLSALNVALPGMAASLNVPALHLNTVIASYAVSLAAFLPLSAWLADRLGARTTFCAAVAIFSFASVLCGMATSVEFLVGCRILQGLGGALMVPIARLIMIRSVPPGELLAAMAWFTIPPTVGRLIGPLVGGTLVTWLSWRWIFFINIPLGIAAFVLALMTVPKIEGRHDVPRFDIVGFLLMAAGMGSFLGGLETFGKGVTTMPVSIGLLAAGAALLVVYVLHGLRAKDPVIDLRILRYPTFRTNVLGALPLRMAMFGGAFALPLLLQMGLGFPAIVSGAVATGSALGAVSTRFMTKHVLARVTLRHMLIGVTTASAIIYCCYALFDRQWPLPLIFVVVLASGLCTSLGMMALNTMGFVEIPRERSSHATALTTMAQQVGSAVGVVLFALLLRISAQLQGGDGEHLTKAHFVPVFLFGGLLALFSLAAFVRMEDEKPHAHEVEAEAETEEVFAEAAD